jgi:D-3-phosphoglycerate dehydrogenase
MDDISYPKEKIKIVLLENIHSNAAKIYQDHGFTNVHCYGKAMSTEELIETVHDARVLGIRSGTHIGKEVLDHCKKLLAIGCYCIGTNQVKLQDAMMQGIPVFNDPHSNTRSVAEMVIGLCIVLMRDLFSKNAAAHLGEWRKISVGSHEIRGKRLGIIGYGRIGSQVSIMAEGLGMQVSYYDIEQKLALGNAKSVSSLEELLKTSDIVTLHVPETTQTHNLMNRERLNLLRKEAILINTSRGKVVDNEVLAELLRSGQIKAAAVDVFPKEPSGSHESFQNPLKGLTNVILTPHIGGATEEAQENISVAVTQKLISFVNRGVTEGATNFPMIALPPHDGANRILHIHENIPGMLSQINKIFADRNLNILSQYLQTNQEIGYVVFDIEKNPHIGLEQDLKRIKGTIRSRILY